jgi:general secretion pathway protein D
MPAALCVLLAACASPALREAEQLSLNGQHEQAYAVLEQARSQDPGNLGLRAAAQREREMAISITANKAAETLAAGRIDAARELLKRLEALDPAHPRTQGLRADLERATRQQAVLAQANQAFKAGRLAQAEEAAHTLLVESPGLPAARELQQRIAERAAEPPAPDPDPAQLRKRITLDFHEAPLRSVFESVGRTQGLNFVFDKEVRTDAKISVLLRDVTLNEAMRIILATQQLDRQMLNSTTMLIYPNTPAKQQEHQELVTRSFYLANADVKQVQNLVRTLAKTRDIYVDERLNLLIVRDTAEVVRVIERLIASVDLPEPEVVLEVEVMEVSTNQLNALGLNWPTEIQYGLPNYTGQVTRSNFSQFRTSIANPAITAKLQGTSGYSNLIANPKLRARNHEKAHVQIGERLPVFTSTAVVNAGVGTTVSYVDTGLKLEVEPSVQLDNDVIMKVNLEVNNLIGQVTGPLGAIAYTVGTRNAGTSLRLHDGETQILAGLINNQDSKAVQGIPELSEMPVLGRLFGVHTDTRDKSEIVLLITPHVVRNLGLPDAATLTGPAGNYSNPGAASRQIRTSAAIAMPASSGPLAARAATTADTATPGPTATLQVSTSGKGAVGDTVSVTLQNQGTAAVRGQFSFDTALLQAAEVDKADHVEFEIPPQGQKVFVLRVLPGAEGKSSQVQIGDLSAVDPNGESVQVQAVGDTTLNFVAAH